MPWCMYLPLHRVWADFKTVAVILRLSPAPLHYQHGSTVYTRASGKSWTPCSQWAAIHHCSCVRLSVKQSGAGPCPRYAHQVAFDHTRKTCYMFGGHPGDYGKVHHNPMRLDDLWSMKVSWSYFHLWQSGHWEVYCFIRLSVKTGNIFSNTASCS